MEGATGRLHVDSRYNSRRLDLHARLDESMGGYKQWDRYTDRSQVQNMHQKSHNDINATWVKEMISTMPKTKHVAPWGRHTAG